MSRRPFAFLLALPLSVGAAPFALTGEPVIVHEDTATMRLAAALLQRDLRAVTGREARLATDPAACRRTCIVVGTAGSALVRTQARVAGIDLAPLANQWERYVRVSTGSTLLIAGSDRRGAVYGVVDLTRELGVSAWEWWADVTPRRRPSAAVDGAYRLSPRPAVRYRGIFLNDEDWGLQPWAAGKDPAGDIGPATYARIFELLWRLKANLVWPAMHASTKPFYQVPGNARTADDYAIMVGTSHAEPMMRNNVREWGKERGPFNFFTNRDALLDYWRERIDEVKGYENVYSLGLRGVHDSSMEGAATVEQARDAVQQVIGLQRDMLRERVGRPVPQALTLYKEVLDVYAAGLQVPDDVTLVWPDDNYGYLHQVSGPREAGRTGGAGIYYHLSYWGRPHDYLWLATTHPALVRDQLQRAWVTGARRLWVVNVGDIKPAEYLTQYFLDSAFDARTLDGDARDHLRAWCGEQFGPALGSDAASALWEYYRLAWERRPEFMGFGQTEPTTPNRPTTYMASGGDAAERRLDAYRQLVKQVEALALRMPADRRDSFFELVLYPLRGAASINERILGLELAAEHARQGRADADALVARARSAHGAIVADTAAYNALGGGKWRGIMDMAPRRLPVFAEPDWPAYGRMGTAYVPETVHAPDSIVTVAAGSAAPHPDWEPQPGLGASGRALRARLDLPVRAPGQGAPLVYRFVAPAAGDARLRLVAVPVHPLVGGGRVRVAYRVDDGPLEVADFTTFGRSEEWKLNVLSNTAVRTKALPGFVAGTHTVRVYALDPGVVLDRIEVGM